MGQSTISELLDFTGGMNTLVAPHLISKREARKLVNVDIRLGTLQSMPNLDFIEPLNNGAFFFQFNRVVYSYPTFRTNVIWDNKWYWSDGITVRKVLEDGTELPLGIPTPTTALTQTLEGTGPHQGDHKYTYTFWSSTTGVESAPAPLPIYVVPDAEGVRLTGFQSLPTGADTYRLYRVGGYLPQFMLVDSFAYNASGYLDILDDTAIDGRILGTMRSGPPPSSLENLVELNGRFYGSKGNKIYYSALGNPDSWYLSDYFLVSDTIWAMAKVPAGLLIMGEFFTSLLYGNQPSNFKLKVLSDNLGCIGKESVAYIGDSAVWLSNRQLVMSNGYKITDITAYKIDRIKGIWPTSAVTDNETYYVSFKPTLFPAETLFPDDGLFPDSVEGTSGVNQGIVALDFKRGNSFSYKIIEYNDIVSLGIIDADIHVGTGGASNDLIPCDEVMFPSCLDFIACTPYSMNRMNVYSGQGGAKLFYRSPTLVDGSRSTLKQYDKVRVSFSGFFDVTVIFDNGNIAVKERITFLNDDDGFAIIGIPNNNNLSSSITFVVEGVGTVRSIQYSWKNREVIN